MVICEYRPVENLFEEVNCCVNKCFATFTDFFVYNDFKSSSNTSLMLKILDFLSANITFSLMPISIQKIISRNSHYIIKESCIPSTVLSLVDHILLVWFLTFPRIIYYTYNGNSKYCTPLGPDEKFGFLKCSVFQGTLRKGT